MADDTIVVFTARSPERIVSEGGSQAWILKPLRAKQCRWLICTQNQHNPNHDFSDATRPHRSAFLLGKIAGIVPPPEDEGSDRRMIRISEYALLDRPNVWDGGRNPVRYTSLTDLGISADGLEFKPIPASTKESPIIGSASEGKYDRLTISAAKQRLAATYDVKPDAIEIVIRG
jgi:hypothetical protein